MKKHVKKDFGKIVMSSEKNDIFEFNQYMKLDKMPYSCWKWLFN